MSSLPCTSLTKATYGLFIDLWSSPSGGWNQFPTCSLPYLLILPLVLHQISPISLWNDPSHGTQGHFPLGLLGRCAHCYSFGAVPGICPSQPGQWPRHTQTPPRRESAPRPWEGDSRDTQGLPEPLVKNSFDSLMPKTVTARDARNASKTISRPCRSHAQQNPVCREWLLHQGPAPVAPAAAVMQGLGSGRACRTC